MNATAYPRFTPQPRGKPPSHPAQAQLNPATHPQIPETYCRHTATSPQRRNIHVNAPSIHKSQITNHKSHVPPPEPRIKRIVVKKEDMEILFWDKNFHRSRCGRLPSPRCITEFFPMQCRECLSLWVRRRFRPMSGGDGELYGFVRVLSISLWLLMKIFLYYRMSVCNCTKRGAPESMTRVTPPHESIP